MQVYVWHSFDIHMYTCRYTSVIDAYHSSDYVASGNWYNFLNIYKMLFSCPPSNHSLSMVLQHMLEEIKSTKVIIQFLSWRVWRSEKVFIFYIMYRHVIYNAQRLIYTRMRWFMSCKNCSLSFKVVWCQYYVHKQNLTAVINWQL